MNNETFTTSTCRNSAPVMNLYLQNGTHAQTRVTARAPHPTANRQVLSGAAAGEVRLLAAQQSVDTLLDYMTKRGL